MSTDTTTRAARLTGWVLLAVPAALAALFLFSAYRNGSFEHKFDYLLLAPNADNIKPGTPVEFAGFAVGNVTMVRLDDSGLAEISLKVSERNARWLRSDSTFLLQQPLLGSPKIVVNSPDLRSPALPAGATRRLQSKNATEELLAQVKPVLADLKTLTGSVADPAGPIRQTLSHLEKVTSRMAERGVMGGLTADPATAGEVDQLVREAHRALLKVNLAMDNTNAQVFGKQGLTDKANAGLSEAVKSLVALREGLQGLTRVIGHGERIAGQAAEGTDGLAALRGDVDLAMRRTNEILRKVEAILKAEGRA